MMGRWWAGLTAGSAPPALPTTDPELIPRGAPVPPPTLAADLVGQRRPPAPQPPARSPQFVSLSASRAVGGPSRSGRRRPLLPRKRGDRRIGPAGPAHSGAPVSPGNAGQASPPPRGARTPAHRRCREAVGPELRPPAAGGNEPRPGAPQGPPAARRSVRSPAHSSAAPAPPALKPAWPLPRRPAPSGWGPQGPRPAPRGPPSVRRAGA